MEPVMPVAEALEAMGFRKVGLRGSHFRDTEIAEPEIRR